ncbi:hypothetical protein [Actinoallomurus vinaceus]|uniref:hypothetical protein n=1 Tax=Actinoallomurus vinaceus TaxID=1080074 RepID=UPI0031E63E1B
MDRIGHDGEHFVLTSADGRSVRGTPQQFTAPKLLPREHNPSYEEQLEECFLATHLLPGGRSRPGTSAPIGPTLDGSHIDDMTQGPVVVSAAGQELWVSFDGSGPEKVAELRPHARRLVAAFDRIRRDGIDFLWATGADGDEPDEEKARFAAGMLPDSLVVYRSGDFEVHFDDVDGRYFPEGYWPAVLYRADMTPVAVTVES